MKPEEWLSGKIDTHLQREEFYADEMALRADWVAEEEEMARHSLEMKFEIWNDDHGARVEIGEDRDGLGMMEIRQVEADGKTYGSVTFDEKAIPLAIEAMQKFQAFKRNANSARNDAQTDETCSQCQGTWGRHDEGCPRRRPEASLADGIALLESYEAACPDEHEEFDHALMNAIELLKRLQRDPKGAEARHIASLSRERAQPATGSRIQMEPLGLTPEILAEIRQHADERARDERTACGDAVAGAVRGSATTEGGGNGIQEVQAQPDRGASGVRAGGDPLRAGVDLGIGQGVGEPEGGRHDRAEPGEPRGPVAGGGGLLRGELRARDVGKCIGCGTGLLSRDWVSGEGPYCSRCAEARLLHEATPPPPVPVNKAGRIIRCLHCGQNKQPTHATECSACGLELTESSPNASEPAPDEWPYAKCAACGNPLPDPRQRGIGDTTCPALGFRGRCVRKSSLSVSEDAER